VSGPNGTALLDDFNRADGALGANWRQAAAAYGPPSIASHVVALGAYSSALWTPNSFSQDQEAYATSDQTAIAQGNVSILLRFTNTGGDGTESGYIVDFDWVDGSTVGIAATRLDPGVSYNFIGYQNCPASGWLYFGASMIGNTISAYTSVDGVHWTLGVTFTDATYPRSGYVGFRTNNAPASGQTLDDFGGGGLPVSSGGGSGTSGRSARAARERQRIARLRAQDTEAAILAALL
jgi:hypothetical protein